MENPEEILHSLEEFSKLKPKDIPRELEDYLCFVAKTGDPFFQWSAVKSLFREKLLNVITDFYESCPTIDIPPCRNVDVFNYEVMKNFILEKLDTFVSAPFTLQRICELLTTPRKEYNRIDKYMRALEKNILVVSTVEPGNRRTENGEGFLNGIETEHSIEINSNSDINVEEMDETSWSHAKESERNNGDITESKIVEPQVSQAPETPQEPFVPESSATDKTCSSNVEPETNKISEDSNLFVSIEPVVSNTCSKQEDTEPDVTVTITAIPSNTQSKRDSNEAVESSEQTTEEVSSSKDESVTNSDIQPTSEAEVSDEPSAKIPKLDEEETKEISDSVMQTDSVETEVSKEELSEEAPANKLPLQDIESTETETPTESSEAISEQKEAEAKSPKQVEETDHAVVSQSNSHEIVQNSDIIVDESKVSTSVVEENSQQKSVEQTDDKSEVQCNEVSEPVVEVAITCEVSGSGDATESNDVTESLKCTETLEETSEAVSEVKTEKEAMDVDQTPQESIVEESAGDANKSDEKDLSSESTDSAETPTPMEVDAEDVFTISSTAQDPENA